VIGAGGKKCVVFSGKNREETCVVNIIFDECALIRPDANAIGVFLWVFCALFYNWR
jgi:hypothetical protein